MTSSYIYYKRISKKEGQRQWAKITYAGKNKDKQRHVLYTVSIWPESLFNCSFWPLICMARNNHWTRTLAVWTQYTTHWRTAFSRINKSASLKTFSNLLCSFTFFEYTTNHPTPLFSFLFSTCFFVLFCPVSCVSSFWYIPCMSFFVLFCVFCSLLFYVFLYIHVFVCLVPSCICYFCSLSLTLPLWRPLIVYITECCPLHCSLMKTVARQSKRLCFKKKG